MIRNTLVIAGKELRVLACDKGQLTVLFLMPIMFATVIGSAFGGGTPGISVLLVNQDPEGAHALMLVDTLRGIGAVRLDESMTLAEADRAVASGRALAAIVIPPEFSARVAASEATVVTVVVDPMQQQYGGIVTGMMHEVVAPVVLESEVRRGVRGVLAQRPESAPVGGTASGEVEEAVMAVVWAALSQLRDDPPVQVDVETIEGVPARRLESAYAYSVPSYGVMFAFFITGSIASSVLAESEEGTLRRLLASPLSRASFLAGKVLGYMLVVLAQMALVFAVGGLLFAVPLGNSLPGMLLLTAALALCAAALGMLVAALARTESQVDTVGTVLAIGLAALGGSIVTIPGQGLLHLLSRLTPHAHAIEGYLTLTSYGGGLADVWQQVALLAGVGTALLLAAVWRFRYET